MVSFQKGLTAVFAAGLLLFLVPVNAAGAPRVRFVQVADHLTSPVQIVSPGDGSGRQFVVQQTGIVVILQNGSLRSTPFLDISSLTRDSGERGLLSLAFHPNFPANGKLYVNYTDLNGNTNVVEYRVSQNDADVVDPATARRILFVRQPYQNHNGGLIMFGPDGMLYIGMGDGGSAGDPQNRAQNLRTLLGKILRIDVDHGRPYAIPAGNPFVAQTGAKKEIWAYGFRNPWRFSFDEPTGRLFVGDVGQNRIEEVDLVRAGKNYGWRLMEGSACYNPLKNCRRSGLQLPITEYSHALGDAVIGGFVYRGSAIPALAGKYIFGDIGSGRIWMLAQTSSGTWRRTQIAKTTFAISSFGEDDQKELYVVDLQGAVYRMEP